MGQRPEQVQERHWVGQHHPGEVQLQLVQVVQYLQEVQQHPGQDQGAGQQHAEQVEQQHPGVLEEVDWHQKLKLSIHNF